MARIVFFEVAPFEREALEAAAFPGHEVALVTAPLTAETTALAEGAAVVSVFVDSRVDEAVVSALPELRFVATRSTGFDHLDGAALRRHGVLASYVPSYGENSVAEHAFALLLALARRVPAAVARTRALDFSLDGLEGRDLKGQTLGVVGLGRIGRHMVRLGRGAGMTIVGHDMIEDPALAEAEGFRYAPLAELLAVSDAVTIHTALTPATRHLLGKAAFAAVKPGALLVNTARGPIVDTEALLAALESGRLAGAGLDVLEGEDLLRAGRQPRDEAERRLLALTRALLRRDDVLVTPHVAFFTREGVARLVAASLANVRAYLAGAPEHLIPGVAP